MPLVADFVSDPIRPGVDARLVDFGRTEYALGSKVQHDERRDNYRADDAKRVAPDGVPCHTSSD